MTALRLCLIGHPVKHSLSPPMHRAAFLSFGLDGSYELLDLENDQISDFLENFEKQKLSGFNVTIPHKELVYKLIENRSPEANLLGAVNTVRLDSSGRLLAHNTDLGGFVRAFLASHESEELSNDNALVLGAGGSARAAIAGLLLLGVKRIQVAARRLEKAKALCSELLVCQQRFRDTAEIELDAIPFEELACQKQISILVNCTPVGLDLSAGCPAWAEPAFAAMARQSFFFDLVYRRDFKPTLLMQMAKERQIKSVDGLQMLACQALMAFEFWTGMRPDMNLLLKAALESESSTC